MPARPDDARLRVLRSTQLLDSPPEAAFDRLTRLASGLLDAPVALISLVDERRQFFKSALGLKEPWASRRETPLTHSFCQYATRERAPLVVEDARLHPVLRDNLAIRDLAVVAYAGFPLVVSGEAIGALCVVDDKARSWSARELDLLRDLAAAAVSEIELRLALRTVREQRALTHALLESLGDPVLAIDPARTYLLANAAARRVFAEGTEVGGTAPPDWSALNRSTRPDGTLLPADEGALSRGLRGEATDGLEFTLQPPGATEAIWVEASGRPVRGENGEVVAAVAVFRDVTEKKRRSEELQRTSVTDELTGLLNRRGFLLVAGQEMKVAARDRRRLVLVFLDVDGMKAINDELGHEVGDRALVDTAGVLRAVFRGSDVIARFGGDEFVVLATDASETSGPALSTRLHGALDAYNASASRFRLSLSMGTSVFDPGDPATLERLLSEADARMYEEKRSLPPEAHRLQAK